MADVSIALIVEGQGEVAAAGPLMRRMAAEIAPHIWVDFLRPTRIGRDALIKQGGIEAAIDLAARQVGNHGSVLVLIDADATAPPPSDRAWPNAHAPRTAASECPWS